MRQPDRWRCTAGAACQRIVIAQSRMMSVRLSLESLFCRTLAALPAVARHLDEAAGYFAIDLVDGVGIGSFEIPPIQVQPVLSLDFKIEFHGMHAADGGGWIDFIHEAIGSFSRK